MSPTRRTATTATAVALTVATALTPLLPWATTGNRTRDGFHLARTARTLGLAESTPLRLLLLGAFALPAIAGLAWVAAAIGRRRLTAIAALAAAAIAITGSVVAFRSDLQLEIGPTAAIVTATLAVVAAAAVAWQEVHGE